jgi:hypothetical protein
MVVAINFKVGRNAVSIKEEKSSQFEDNYVSIF